jgi:flavin-dependent dehydrogenase
MSLSERNRSALYQGLSEVIDPDAVEEMLSYFPARDVEEPVTKEYLRAELALVRLEMAELRAELRTELHTELRRMQAWMIGTAATLGAVLIGAMALLR